jgi:soluble lytic murein transglycosylase-like protein
MLTRPGLGTGDSVDTLISKHAQRYGLPESLLRRVVKRESGGNPHLRHGPYLGLMQMRLDTARGMGYNGGAEGLLDANTSLTYGAAYLANAWRVSGGNPDRAVSLYSGGYYYEAKRKGMLPRLIKGVPAK